MKSRYLLAALLLLNTGCIARFTTKQTDERGTDEYGQAFTKIETKATAWTWGDSKSSLANFKASQTEKTQGAAVGSLTQETGGTNTASTLRALDDLLKTAIGK